MRFFYGRPGEGRQSGDQPVGFSPVSSGSRRVSRVRLPVPRRERGKNKEPARIASGTPIACRPVALSLCGAAVSLFLWFGIILLGRMTPFLVSQGSEGSV